MSFSRCVALVLVVAPLAACGVLNKLGEDTPDLPGRADADGDGSPGGEGGSLDDANVLLGDAAGDAGEDDASGDAADACATPATCSPELLVKLAGGVYCLVAAGTNLYAAHMAAAAPRVVRFAAGAPGPALDLDPYASGPDVFRANSNIAVDATGAVYWGTANGLRRHDSGAGADASVGAGVTDLSSLGAPVSGVRIANGQLQYVVSNPQGIPLPNIGHMGTCDLPGCTNPQDGSFAPYVLDVMVIGASVWWMGADNVNANMALRKNSGALSGEQLTPSRMATDGQHIFWSTFDGLRMYTIATGALVDLLAAPTGAATRVNGITVDPAGALYVTQQSNVLRCAIANDKCSFSTIATTPNTATNIAADATYLYWGTDDGSVWRLRKP